MRTDLANARLPRAALLPGASWHGHIDLVAVDLVLAGHRPASSLDDDHKLYAIVNRPGTIRGKARVLGLAELTVARYTPEGQIEDGPGRDGGGSP
ncbi:hypothetical protein ACFV27_00615 [Streptomyces antimycoticus]|uniref:hypothetical protein n=1 Tax=Streptomyces antimycoticus TaxID=68175 RepID=UPI0036AB354F